MERDSNQLSEKRTKIRKELMERIRAASERANLSPEEADKLAAEAVRAVRAGVLDQRDCD